MRIKRVLIIIIILIMLPVNNIFALNELQERAADLDWDGDVDEQDLEYLMGIGYPDMPKNGVVCTNGKYLNFDKVANSSESGLLIGWAFTCLHENAPMWIYCYGNEESAKTETAKQWITDYNSHIYIYNYISEDRELMYEASDGLGHDDRNYGWGCLVYYDGTRYDSDFAEYGADVLLKVRACEPVSTKICTEISISRWKSKREEVINTINNLGYSEDDFEDYQIDCMADIRYQGYFVSNLIKTYMSNNKQCNDSVRGSCSGFTGNGSRGTDRWTLFSEGKYQLTYDGVVWYELDPDNFGRIENATEVQQRIIKEATENGYQYDTRSGYCLSWVAGIYRTVLGNDGYGNCARCAGYKHGVSNDFDKIEPGAAVYRWHGGYVNGIYYGHVGIYIGNGMVRSNYGGLSNETLESFISGNNPSQKYSCWGWQTEKPLSGTFSPGAYLKSGCSTSNS